MLQFYSVTHTIIDKKTNIELCSWTRFHDICSNDNLTVKSVMLTWDNINDISIYSMLNPEIKKRKKGRIFKCHASLSYDLYTFKEWKRSELNLEYVTEYTPVTKSINEILEYGDSTIAIQYLMERGIEAQVVVNKKGIGAILSGIR